MNGLMKNPISFFFRGKRQKFPSEDGETVILFFNRMLAPERS